MIDLLGKSAEPIMQGPLTVWEVFRWPFIGRVTQIPTGQYVGQLCEGAFTIHNATEADSAQAVAAELDGVAKACFADSVWYQP